MRDNHTDGQTQNMKIKAILTASTARLPGEWFNKQSDSRAKMDLLRGGENITNILSSM